MRIQNFQQQRGGSPGGGFPGRHRRR
jgi:hypothetical protein